MFKDEGQGQTLINNAEAIEVQATTVKADLLIHCRTPVYNLILRSEQVVVMKKKSNLELTSEKSKSQTKRVTDPKKAPEVWCNHIK